PQTLAQRTGLQVEDVERAVVLACEPQPAAWQVICEMVEVAGVAGHLRAACEAQGVGGGAGGNHGAEGCEQDCNGGSHLHASFSGIQLEQLLQCGNACAELVA